jgi:hypothetical protein
MGVLIQNARIFFCFPLPSSIFHLLAGGQQAQQTVYRGQDDQQDAGFSVNAEFNLDPVKAAEELKEQQQKIDDAQYKDNGNSGDGHRENPTFAKKPLIAAK